jgi:hypothetical protein
MERIIAKSFIDIMMSGLNYGVLVHTKNGKVTKMVGNRNSVGHVDML